MTKNTKILLGVAAVAGLGYYFFMMPKKASFMNVEGGKGCPCKKVVGRDGDYNECAGGHYCKRGGKSEM
jgi:hypothetical protein